MGNTDVQIRIKAVKERIQKLIEAGNLSEARSALEKYNNKMPGDTDICSMMAVIHILEGSLDEAENILNEGLEKDSVQFDLMFNLAYIFELRGKYQAAADLYCKSATVAGDEQRRNIDEAIQRIKTADAGIIFTDKPKIIFFVKNGMDSFLGDIIDGMSKDYWVRKMIVGNLKQIDEGMEWADVCWFEWCDELVVYGSGLPAARQKKIVCRLHSYEAFTEHIYNTEWENIDKVVFIADHVRDVVLEKQKKLRTEQTVIIPNGIDIEKYTFRKGEPGFNVAYVGYLNYKKGPMLLLHTFKALYDRDNRYKLYIAGEFQDYRDELYFSQMIKEFGIENNVFFEGWQDDINHWLNDKNYILCTSLLESQNLSVMQAMCKGIKPVIHNFVGARGIYPDEYIWNTIDEAVMKITEGGYEPEEYRTYVVKNYGLCSQLGQISRQLSNLLFYKEVISNVSDIISGNSNAGELPVKELTVLIPCHNRAKMLMEDMISGLKLGNLPKMIVDDCSTIEREWLDTIYDNFHKNGTVVIKKDKNGGVAESRHTGLNAIDTRFTTFVDDDNIMLCIDKDEAMDRIALLDKDVSIVVPRYIINYYSQYCSLGYDRQFYNNMKGSEVLKDLASTGEMMGILTGGAIGETEWMRQHSSCPSFRVSEDFVMLARMMADRPEMRVATTEGLVFVRRFLDEGSTMNPNAEKLALSLISQTIACYYCLEQAIADKEEVFKWMKNRAALIQRLYDFGEDFETELIAYLTGGINEEVFIHFLALHGFKLYDSLDELAPELRKMRALLYEELQTQENTSAVVEPLPLVSILIPTFNRRDMLKRAVDSVLKQDYGNLEVIVMDNCSEDGTEEMIRSNYRNEKRLVYIRNERNLGPNASVVKGFYHYTTGKYCLLLFDDDYFIYSKYLAECVDFLETHDNVSFVFGDKYYNNLIENKVYRVEAKQPDVVNGLDYFINFKSEKYPIMPSTNTVLFRRDIAVKNEVMGGEANTVIGDLILLVKLSLLGDIGYINRIVVVYTLHNGSMSCNIDNRIAVKNDDGGKKAVATAKDDIVELTKLGKKASDLKRLDRDIIDKWLSNRIFNYLFWRFNETVKSNEECIALLRFVKDNYIDYYVWFRDFASKKYGEELLKELRYNDETCFYNS